MHLYEKILVARSERIHFANVVASINDHLPLIARSFCYFNETGPENSEEIKHCPASAILNVSLDHLHCLSER